MTDDQRKYGTRKLGEETRTRPLKDHMIVGPFSRERPKQIIPWVIDFHLSSHLVQIQVREQMVIGRGSGAGAPDVDFGPYVTEEDGLSRRHAILLARKNFLTIRDMGSTNGTFINGLRLANNQDFPLEHGDTITFGRLEARLMFAVLPPDMQATADSEYQPLQPVADGNGRHVLVVEDDDDVALAYKMMLRAAGYRVTTARNLYQVDRVLAEELPQAVVVDMHMRQGMQDYTGLRVLEHVKDCAQRFNTRVPMIVVSGSVDAQERQQAVEAGAHLFLPKPVRVDELAVRIGMLIKQLNGTSTPH
ncbi:MAG: response regulator [Chloroflexota bacterium]